MANRGLPKIVPGRPDTLGATPDARGTNFAVASGGDEGPTDDPDVLALRARQERAFLMTLLLSGGVPMVLGGDELGRTQRGNNDAYCQDNEITWFDWSAADDVLIRFTTGLIALRRRHPVFRRRRFPTGTDAADLRWFTPSGAEMTPQDWAFPLARSIALFIDGTRDPDVAADGNPLIDDDFLVLVNAWWEPLTFSVPDVVAPQPWEIVCDSFDPARTGRAAQRVEVGPRSAVVMRSGR
jgi:isoamylase